MGVRVPDPLAQALSALPGPLVVAHSGGLDSSVLLHALATATDARALGLRALHVDHRLHPQSSAWAAASRAFCAGLGIDCAVIEVDVDASGRGLEAAARDARYRAFEQALAADETLVLAHHADDQAETVLLRLLRGAGSAGLAGMPPRRALGGGRLWRPLLDIGRDRLLDYAQRHALRWIDDPANVDLRHERNFIRHRVLPLLRERWPRAARTLAISARLLAEDAALLDRQVEHALAAVRGLDPRTLQLPDLQALPEPMQRHVLRRWLAELGLPAPPGAVLARLGPELFDAQPDREPRLAWRGAVLQRYRDLLFAERAGPALRRDWQLRWDGAAPLELPPGFGRLELRPPGKAIGTLHVAPRRGGERLMPAGRPRRPLKRLLQEHGVPPWERARLPLLFADDGELLAAGDLLLAGRAQALFEQAGVVLRWNVDED